ncbi:unnamed protein product, partial [Mesorhabditis spiculigera]
MTKLDESPYTILGIPKDSEPEAIKKAYRKLALKWHPDKHQEAADKEVAEKKFKKIAQAYEILSDGKKKSALDREAGRTRRPFREEVFREFSTVIRFSSATEPGKAVSTTKTTTTTKVIDGKKIVTKRTEDNGKEMVETYEDGKLKSQVVHATAVAAN